MQSKKYWLMKSEPDVFSIEDLKKNSTTWWTGVRNYQARNFMKNDMQVGDEVLFYHSNAEPPGIAGLALVAASAEPDQEQFDKKSEYFEKRATKENPVWFCVQLKFKQAFLDILSLEYLKNDPKLSEMLVIKKGQRLSIQPVSEKDFLYILKLARWK
jgi:predicted RNA-binding protein with PUA-like domain